MPFSIIYSNPLPHFSKTYFVWFLVWQPINSWDFSTAIMTGLMNEEMHKILCQLPLSSAKYLSVFAMCFLVNKWGLLSISRLWMSQLWLGSNLWLLVYNSPELFYIARISVKPFCPPWHPHLSALDLHFPPMFIILHCNKPHTKPTCIPSPFCPKPCCIYTLRAWKIYVSCFLELIRQHLCRI